MKKLQFKKDINAPVEKVYTAMIGKETYKEWTSVFNPSPDSEGTMEGSWEKGSKVLFVGISKEGKREGMVANIKENIPNQFISIQYKGILDGDKEITEGPVADEWQGFENYTFQANDSKTTVIVDIDVNDQMHDYFLETYPKALDKLKEISER